MQARNHCGATGLKIYRPTCGNYGYNGKASGKVGTYCVSSRPAGRFSRLQFDDLFVEHHKFLFYDHVFMVVSEKPVFELAPLAYLIEELC